MLTDPKRVAHRKKQLNTKRIAQLEKRIAELEEQIEFFHSVVDALPDPLFVKNEEHRVILVNNAHCRLVGRTADEILAPQKVDPTLSEELAIFLEQDKLAFANDHPIENEEYLTDSQGYRHVISTRKVSHRLANGKKILIATARDITQRREMEERLQHEQALMHQLIDSIPDLIFYKNMNNVYVGCNRAFEELCGRTEAELIGMTTAEIFPTMECDEFEQQDQAVLHEKQTIRAEQRVTYPDGNVVILDTFVTPFWSPTGEALGLLGISRDITERKTTEEELRRAKEAAESANHTKSTFLSTITHELRTPMNGVLGLSNLLLETELTSAQLDLVNTIHTSGHTLLSLINDILDFSKIEANKIELETHSFDLRLCTETVLDLVAAQAAAKGLTLTALVDPALPTYFEQDETRIRQILTNLLSNAVKFSDHGDIVVHVRGTELDGHEHGSDSNDHWELQFTVQDSGIGIARERMARLFQPFDQIDPAINRRYGGTGLGLAISKRLTELMGGVMWVESEIGQGSQFHFTINAKKSLKQHTAWNSDSSLLRGRHILIIEPSVALERLLVQHLTAWEINVTLHRVGEPMPTTAETATIDAVIVDAAEEHGIPERNGTQRSQESVIAHLKETLPTVPIVLLTQLGDRTEIDQFQQTVIPVTKPIHALQLHDALIAISNGSSVPIRRANRTYTYDREMAKRKPLRILLADDNVVNQKVVTGILANHGYRIDIVADGIEVLDALNRQQYDVVLMDLNMPEMNGITTTEIIRNSWPQSKQPHIIALTANTLHDDHKRCMAAGMNDYITKPIQVAAFIQAILRVPVPFGRRELTIPNHPTAFQTTEDEQPQLVSQLASQPLPQPIDLSILHEIAATAGENSATFFHELVTLFLESTPPQFTQLRQAIAEQDLAAVGQVAHTLRSPAAQLGAQTLVDLCAELEKISAEKDLHQCHSLVPQIVDEYKRVEYALKQTLTQSA